MSINIEVYNTILSESADDDQKGNKVYDEIIKYLNNDDVITIDFTNIKLINTAFLNNAIGNLYAQNSLLSINNKLRIKNIDSEDIEMFKEVIMNAAEKYVKDNIVNA
jgi:hypothetical protein